MPDDAARWKEIEGLLEEVLDQREVFVRERKAKLARALNRPARNADRRPASTASTRNNGPLTKGNK